MAAAPMPAITVPVLDAQGRMTSAWYAYFQDRHARTGGGLDLTLSGSDTSFTATVTDANGAQKSGSLVLS